MGESRPRYALYFAPDPASALWRFGSACIGYDAAAGALCAPLDVPGVAPEVWTELTSEPRRYGFHATLKAPFHLRDGAQEGDLFASLDAFAQAEAPFHLAGLRIATLSRFIALVPAAPSAPLQALAARVVTVFEPFRAPLLEADVARRLRSPLSDRQTENLHRWGYPYVFEEFRFHMTLTGGLEEADRARAFAALERFYAAQVGDGPVEIGAVCVFRQDRRDAPFRIVRRAPLGARSRA